MNADRRTVLELFSRGVIDNSPASELGTVVEAPYSFHPR
jgi:hypothetical protein